MKQKLKITVLVDTATISADDPDFTGEHQSTTTEHHVINTLRKLGHNVSILGAVDDIRDIISGLTDDKPDMVFNLTEHFGGDRRLDKNIAALLELVDVPFTGSGAMGLMLSRDKRLCKQLMSLHRIRVPDFISIPPDRKIRIPAALRYPLVVKPAFEDSSEGISQASFVTNEAALRERASFVHERWRQPAIAEEYIEGREFYVSVMGNKKLVVFPIRECFFGFDRSNGPHLATYRVKWSAEYRKKWNITFGFAELDAPVVKNIQRICRKVYHILQIRDYGRIDVRLTPDNRLVVLEANPNPDVAYGEEVAEAAEKAGLIYERFIERILRLALARYA